MQERAALTTIGGLARMFPIHVLRHTGVEDAARFMADLGGGDVILTEPETGTNCSRPVTTISAGASVATAAELMRNEICVARSV